MIKVVVQHEKTLVLDQELKSSCAYSDLSVR
jgi:hypothetical protein